MCCDSALRGQSQRFSDNVGKTQSGGETSKKMDMEKRREREIWEI